MSGETKQRWLDLCAEAIVCDDPKRFAELTSQITFMLAEKERRLLETSPTAA